MQSLKSLFLLFVVAVCVASCKPTIPSKYIQPDQMENILYDYHVAQAYLDNEPGLSTDYNRRYYKLAILKKHGVTEAEFDSSMVYYTRHIDNLHVMYEHISDRLEAAAESLGADVNDLDSYGTVASADTANVWNRERNVLLLSHMPYNVLNYSINADTAFHKGDRMILSFDVQYIYKEGMRNAAAVMSVRFGNDSVASRNIFINSQSHYSMDISDYANRGIKSIGGFFYVDTQENMDVENNPLQLFFIRNIKLVRLHKKEQEVPNVEQTN